MTFLIDRTNRSWAGCNPLEALCRKAFLFRYTLLHLFFMLWKHKHDLQVDPPVLWQTSSKLDGNGF